MLVFGIPNKKYLLAFVNVQNLAEFGIVVEAVCKF